MWAEEGEKDTQRQTEHEDRRDTLGEGPAVGGRVATAWGSAGDLLVHDGKFCPKRDHQEDAHGHPSVS